MALYEFSCDKHGTFEILQGIRQMNMPCPVCSQPSRSIISAPAHSFVKFPERLQYGTGSKGRIISGKETGGLDMFIPSGGAMEKSEIDDVACAAIEKEKGRVKRLKGKYRSANQEAISNLTNLAYQTKKGDRIKVLREAITESGLDNKIKVA